MSTRNDRNFKSYDGLQENVSDEVLDPIGAGWEVGTWQDTAKFYRRTSLTFFNFTIKRGGTEDAVDVSPKCVGNTFDTFNVRSGDTYVLTLKGDSNDNVFKNWTIESGGKWVDVEIGNWSSSAFGPSTGNQFINWVKTNGEPIKYAYRFGCKPTWVNTKTKHVWWLSVGVTAYWYFKYFIHRILKISDK